MYAGPAPDVRFNFEALPTGYRDSSNPQFARFLIDYHCTVLRLINEMTNGSSTLKFAVFSLHVAMITFSSNLFIYDPNIGFVSLVVFSFLVHFLLHKCESSRIRLFATNLSNIGVTVHDKY